MTAVENGVLSAVDAWLRWLPSWSPGNHRGRARMCRRCTGSPMLVAAGIGRDVPHQVSHALTSRMQRIIDRAVDEFTASELPALHAELTGAELWDADAYDPRQGLPVELDGLDLDPEPEDGTQPFLFTLADLAAETPQQAALPRPPLTAAERATLAAEIDRADACAAAVGGELCLVLSEHRDRIAAAIERFVEPQVQALLDELSAGLEPPQ